VNNEITYPYTLPVGWVWTNLGEVGDILAGYGFPKKLQGNTTGDLPFFKVADISSASRRGDIFLRHATNYISTKVCNEIRAIPFRKGTVVFAKIGEAIKLNRRAILAQDSLVDNNVAGFLPSDGISALFAFYFSLTLKLEELSRATTVPSVRKTDLERIDFPLPPLPEQHRIVLKIEELFTKLDAGIESLSRIKAELKHYRQSVLEYAFGGKLTEAWREAHKHELEPASVLLERIKQERQKTAKGKYRELPPLDTSNLPELPEGWAWTMVGQLSEAIQYGYTASSTSEPAGPKMLRITDIQNNCVDWEAVPYCRIKNEEKLKYLLEDGDLVFARTGATVGKSFLIRGAIPESVFASYLIRIALSRHINKTFVYSFFQSYDYWMQIYAGQLGIGQPNVNSQTLSRILVPLSPILEQHEIVSEIERHFSVADEIERTIDQGLKQAERLRRSILKRAFEGKLVRQDPYDEPAEKLLEHIKQERAKQQAAAQSTKVSRNGLTTQEMRLM
jgi:type I restriction enzyme S subunit